MSDNDLASIHAKLDRLLAIAERSPLPFAHLHEPGPLTGNCRYCGVHIPNLSFGCVHEEGTVPGFCAKCGCRIAQIRVQTVSTTTTG